MERDPDGSKFISTDDEIRLVNTREPGDPLPIERSPDYQDDEEGDA